MPERAPYVLLCQKISKFCLFAFNCKTFTLTTALEPPLVSFNRIHMPGSSQKELISKD